MERSPSMPDYSGLDIVAGTDTLLDGRASTFRFNEWVSSRMKERQERKTRVGKGAGRDHGDTSDDEEPGAKGKKKKKKKKKGKGITNPASGSGGAGAQA